MKIFILLLVLISQQIIVTNAKIRGHIFVELLSFDNPTSRKDNGEKCDAWFSEIMKDLCDVFFTVCISNADNVPIKNCDLGKISTVSNIFHDATSLRFGRHIGFIPNPFNISLWDVPEHVKITVNIIDDDDISGNDPMSQLEIVAKLPILNYKLTEPTINPISINSKYNLMTVRFYGECQPDYYGTRCNNYCIPSNTDAGGYYGCDKVTGAKHCLDGWTGLDCKQVDLCARNNPCRASSICFMKGTILKCSCPPTLTGRYCEKPVIVCKDPSVCVNRGICVVTVDNNNKTAEHCECPANFHSNRCELDLDECNIPLDTNTNQNNKYCRIEHSKCTNHHGSYLCECRDGYWGVHCHKPPVYLAPDIDNYLQQANYAGLSNPYGYVDSGYLQFNVLFTVIIILVCTVSIGVSILLYMMLCHKSNTKSLDVEINQSPVRKDLNKKSLDDDLSIYSECRYENAETKSELNPDQNEYELESDLFNTTKIQ